MGESITTTFTGCSACGVTYTSNAGHRCGESPEEIGLRSQLATTTRELEAAKAQVAELTRERDELLACAGDLLCYEEDSGDGECVVCNQPVTECDCLMVDVRKALAAIRGAEKT